MLIQVTQDHIARGRRSACHLCPIALALAEALHATPDEVGVTPYGAARYTGPGAFHAYWTDAHVRPWIEAFDAGQPVAPFSFDLAVPS